MTSQYDFTNEQWHHVVQTPVLVGLAVARAEDSGFFGSMRETRTLLSELATQRSSGPADTLIAQASAADTGDFYEAMKALSPEALANDATLACERLHTILVEVAGEAEATAYKSWIVDIARSVAEAATEDGSRVSDGEAKVLDRISRALVID